MHHVFSTRSLVTAGIICAIGAGISAFKTQHPPVQHHHNFKVLPQDISRDSLEMIMDHFKIALGVKCNFCHAPSQDHPGHLDFESDAKPEKEVARKMLVMTNDINQKYMNFNADSTSSMDTIPVVSCITCHRGDPHPETKYPKESDEHHPPQGQPAPPPTGGTGGDR